jgi:hypothetical protein
MDEVGTRGMIKFMIETELGEEVGPG